MEKEPILFYGKEFYMFSNFSAFAIEYKKVLWMTAEHAYQAEKFTDEKIREEIQKARSAKDAKDLGEKYKDSVRGDWFDINLSIMEGIVRAKLDQHPYVMKKLVQSGDREIIEDSSRDAFWGWGPDKKGLNNLGKIWMKLRDEIIQK